jgi:hypothetical protein
MGVGIAELRAMVILELEVAAETCVEAAAPVRTRATTAARTMMFFMVDTPKVVFTFKIFRWTRAM